LVLVMRIVGDVELYCTVDEIFLSPHGHVANHLLCSGGLDLPMDRT